MPPKTVAEKLAEVKVRCEAMEWEEAEAQREMEWEEHEKKEHEEHKKRDKEVAKAKKKAKTDKIAQDKCMLEEAKKRVAQHEAEEKAKAEARARESEDELEMGSESGFGVRG